MIRIREEITEDLVSGPYWRFNDPYALQIGVGRHGDLPKDIKFQYGAAVLRGPAIEGPSALLESSVR